MKKKASVIAWESQKSIGSAGGSRALGWTSTGSSLRRPGQRHKKELFTPRSQQGRVRGARSGSGLARADPGRYLTLGWSGHPNCHGQLQRGRGPIVVGNDSGRRKLALVGAGPSSRTKVSLTWEGCVLSLQSRYSFGTFKGEKEWLSGR
jgi:hypothetical protein